MRAQYILAMLLIAAALSTSALAASREPGFFGINAPLYYPGSGILFTPQMADNLNDLGARWVRLEFIRETNGTINYSSYDYVVDAAATRGISVLGILDYSSVPWYPQEAWSSASFRSVFVNRVSEIVSHFSPRITAWEIWNEEDCTFYVEPNAYAELLRQSYDTIKAIDPSATVVLGGLCFNDYLNSLYESPSFSSYHPMDAVGVHPYNWTSGPYSYMTYYLRDYIKPVMNAHGDNDKRLWLTEVGWNVCPDSPTSVGPGQSVESNEQKQALYVSQLFALTATLTDHGETEPLVEKILLFNYGDFGTDWFGVIRGEGTKRPSFYAFKVASGGPMQEGEEYLPAGWNLFSIPLCPDDPAADSVLSACVDAGNDLTGNLYGYAGIYLPYPGDLADLSVGAGYWLRLTNGSLVSYWGTAAESSYDVPLSGWTLVGHPRAAAVAWADVEVTDGATTLAVPDAAAAGWIQGQAFYYDGAGYHTLDVSGGDDTHLRPWSGYWVLANVPGLSLLIP